MAMGLGGREPIHLADGVSGWVSDGSAGVLASADQAVPGEETNANSAKRQDAKGPI
jgi:hypothetical protein